MMKKQILLILAILTSSWCFSQIKKDASAQELKHLGFTISNSISDYPEQDKLIPSSKVYLGTVSDEDEYFVCLLFARGDSSFYRSNIIKLPNEEESFRCEQPVCVYSDGLLVCECTWMRGITFTQKYAISNAQLTYVESYQYDLNEHVYQEAEEAKKNDDPISYCLAYSQAQNYSMDMNQRGLESLTWAHKQALVHAENQHYSKAAAIMLSLEECWISTCKNLYPEFPDQVLEAWGDAAQFYFQAKELQACIELCETLLNLAPSATAIHLQYGDALYQTENGEFKKAYSTYLNLMKNAGRANEAPDRVVNRLKESK